MARPFAEKAAIVEMRRVIDDHEDGLATVRPEAAPTFDEAAADWLHRLEHVDGVKPSTLANYHHMLTSVDAPARKRGRRAAGRIMAEFGGQELHSITTAQVERFLARLDTEPVSKRTVNAHRQVASAILEHASRRPERFGITETSPAPPPSAASRPRPWSTSTSRRRWPRWHAPPARPPPRPEPACGLRR